MRKSVRGVRTSKQKDPSAPEHCRELPDSCVPKLAKRTVRPENQVVLRNLSEEFHLPDSHVLSLCSSAVVCNKPKPGRTGQVLRPRARRTPRTDSTAACDDGCGVASHSSCRAAANSQDKISSLQRSRKSGCKIVRVLS